MAQARQTANPATPAARPGSWPIWVKTARPFTLTAAVSPVLVGTAVAGYEGTFRPILFIVTLLSCVFLQIGANFFNEYFDHRYGLDSVESLGASTVIFTGELTAQQVLLGGVVSFVLAALLGLVLIFTIGPVIILFGLAGLAIAYFYSAKPFKFASRGLGDPLVYLAMGFLMTWGAYFVQLHHWSWRAFAASVPVGLLVTAILNMNNTRDYDDDLKVHKRTLPVRFGRRFGQRYHATLLIGAYIATTIFALVGPLPLLTLGVWLTFPLAYTNVRDVLAATERRAFMISIKRTSQLHLIFGATLAFTIVLATLFHMPR